MDVEVKQRNRRRKRAQRMQAQRESNNKRADGEHQGGDSGDDEEDVLPAKPPRPPNRRKKSKEPLCEEDIIDGFAILQFRTYEDLELVLKISTKENIKRLTEIERPKIEPKAHITNHILVQHNHGLTLSHDPATSDDSGRASERLTGSSVAPRDADSSRDRLSDASSRCSSGKGYICDSEGEDDKDNSEQDVGKETTEIKEKEGHQETVDTPLTSPSDEQGSDASSVIFASTPGSRKHEFPGALPPHHHHHHHHHSPVPAPTPPNLPVPSPAPAQQPPIPSAAAAAPVAVNTTPAPTPPPPPTPPQPIKSTQDNLPPPPPPTTASAPHQVASVPTVTMPQPAAAPIAHHHQQPAAAAHHHHHHHHHAALRTDSPAVATSANAAVAPYHHPQYQHQPLYAPYAAVTSAMAPYTTAPTTPYTTAAPPAAIPTSAAAAAAPPSAPAQQPAVKPTPPPPPLHGDREKHLVPPSPRGPSPVRESRERESYSNVSSLSRSSVSTTPSCPPPPPITTAVSSSLTVNKSWGGGASSSATSSTATAASRRSPAPPRPTFQATASTGGPQPPMFAAPLPPPISRASPITPSSTASGAATPAVPPQPNPNPFSAESLFQSSKYQSSPTDMLRRELDSRFLASQDRSLGVAPPPYLRTEMHQHQHHHTHVHQHTTSLLPPTAASTLYPSPLFKDIPKLGSVDSPFYRQNLGLPSTYPGYTPGLLHPGLTTGPTPFVPPNHLTTFQPKSVTPQDPSKPKIMKTGKWNAMHVRVAWEIYHHQQKSGEAKGNITAAKSTSDLLRPPTHLFSPSVHSQRPPHELATFPPSLSSHRPPGFDQPHPGSLFSSPGHLGKSPFATGASISPFTRYGGGPLGASGASPYSMSPFRDGHLGLGPLHHDPWRGLPRTIPTFPPSVNPLPPTLPGLTPPGPAPWSLKPDPILEQREREAREREERERERLRREREERERREREEKQRRIEQQQQQEQRERERREREKREMERRELERQRERERERLLQEQRLAESAKQLQAPMMRDRSPLRNGDLSEIRVKEEPRVKEEDLLARADHRYNPFLRHPGSLPPPPGPGSVLDRSRMLPPHALPPHHYAGPHWAAPPPPTDPFYRYSYNPLVVDAMRAQEERANFFYGPPQHHQLRKDPSLMHLRTGPQQPQQQQQQQQQPPSAHKVSVTPPDLHKKEEPR